jgi:hypothetical protein
MRLLGLIVLIPILISSCESAQEKENRQKLQEQARVELAAENQRIAEELESENQRITEENRQAAELERKTQELYNRYINNSLSNGSTPYSSCFVGNRSCADNGCSEIQVKSPTDSDVVVTIKNGNQVFRHAYIKAGNRYTFQLPNGTYQPFFYYGRGWNPEQEMPSETCKNLKGGFISDTQVGKDDPQELTNTVLTYSLILQPSGNFSTKPSNENEAF